MTPLTVTFENVTAGYQGRAVLHSLDLAVPAGLTFLVGDNGAGKTTLFRVLLGLVRPTSGTVRIAGTTLRRSSRSRRDLAKYVGYLPQDFRVPPHMRVGDFVMYMAWLRGIARADLEDRARDAVSRVDMESHWPHRLGTLSGGMLRRVGVAQAIVAQPILVLLDEPTVGLDPAARVQLRSLVADLASAGERSVICSTHLLEDAARTGGRLVALHQGHAVFSGPTKDLLDSAEGAVRPGASSLESAFMRLVEGRA